MKRMYDCFKCHYANGTHKRIERVNYMSKSERTEELERMLAASKAQDYADSQAERDREKAERKAKESARIQSIKSDFSWSTEGEGSWIAVDLEENGDATIYSYYQDQQNEYVEFTKSDWEGLRRYMNTLDAHEE